MGNRLSKLYTRTGDDGTSGLSGGTRVAKDHARMNAMGTVDELNSMIGLMVAKLDDAELSTLMVAIQHDLFNIGGEISMPGYSFIKPEKIELLDLDFFTQITTTTKHL